MQKMQENSVTMKDLPASEQPYELMETKGASALTDAQLLAILLKTGSSGEKAVELTTRLLSTVPTQGRDPLMALCHQPLRLLKTYRGVGRVKALQLKALAELSKRMSSKGAAERMCLDSPETVAQLYMEEMRYLSREVIKVVYFNTKSELLGDRNLAQGTINQSLISPREIFLTAWEWGAYSFILIHNHPSGNPAPSINDLLLTDRLRQAAQLMEIPMLDHIILGDGKYYSFKEHQKMQRDK